MLCRRLVQRVAKVCSHRLTSHPVSANRGVDCKAMATQPPTAGGATICGVVRWKDDLFGGAIVEQPAECTPEDFARALKNAAQVCMPKHVGPGLGCL